MATNRYFPGFSDGSDIVETCAGIAAGAADEINNHADENRDAIIGANAEGIKKVLDAIKSTLGEIRRKYFAGKAAWFIVLMTILAIGFGYLIFKITGLPMFQEPDVDLVTGVATGKMVRNSWTYVLSPILGFTFWVFFIYLTDLGLPKSN